MEDEGGVEGCARARRGSRGGMTGSGDVGFVFRSESEEDGIGIELEVKKAPSEGSVLKGTRSAQKDGPPSKLFHRGLLSSNFYFNRSYVMI